MADNLSEQVRNEAQRLPGLVEHLEQVLQSKGKYESKDIVDVKVDEANGIAAYIVDLHQWGSSMGGIGMSAEIYLFINGHEIYLTHDWYRDKWDPRRDNWDLDWQQIKELNIEGNRVNLKVTSGKKDKKLEYLLKPKEG